MKNVRNSEQIRQSRTVEQLVAGKETSDGAGVKLTRVLTQPLQRRLDPFLMLDAFGSDKPDEYIAGFPDHPHRGFETVTYMLEGQLRHRDNHGGEGVLAHGVVGGLGVAVCDEGTSALEEADLTSGIRVDVHHRQRIVGDHAQRGQSLTESAGTHHERPRCPGLVEAGEVLLALM